MVFNTLEELKAAVSQRRQEILTLEVDLGAKYSQEHEDAKKELLKAEVLQGLANGGFLNSNIDALKARVAETKPAAQSIWIQFKRLDLDEWAKIAKQVGGVAIDQYERVLPETFVGLFGQDPDPEEKPDGWVAPEPLSTDPAMVSFQGEEGVLPGGALNPVVSAFMAWQNSGGDVSIRPTKSGRV